ncbi:MAG: type I restriction enzyme endonuclease domain-containing protein, partial [Byssovorax sp.]
RLQTRHAAAMRVFLGVKDKDDLAACVAVLEPEDVRAEFETAFKRFAQSLDMLLPDPRALPYTSDARWLGKIRATAAAKYRDARIDVSDCGAKVKKLIEDAIVADGIQILVQRVSLFTPEFEKKLSALKSDEARASEMEHALKDEIHLKLEEDPAFYSSLRERLEKLVEDKKAKRIDAAQQLELFEALKQEARGHAQAAEKVGLSEIGFAIYGLLVERRTRTVSDTRSAPYGAAIDEPKRELASLLEEQLAPKSEIIDWIHKDDVQREMRQLIKRQLRAASYGASEIDAVAESVVDLLKRRRAR